MKNALFNHHLEEDLDELFSPHFEILLLEAYEEMEEEDSILFIGKKESWKYLIILQSFNSARRV